MSNETQKAKTHIHFDHVNPHTETNQTKYFSTKDLNTGQGVCSLSLVTWYRKSVTVTLVLPLRLHFDDSVLFFTSDPTGHGCDQGCSLPASIL